MIIFGRKKIRELERLVKFWKDRAEEYEEIGWKLSRYAPKPKCKLCGSDEKLVADPAGYYCHAEDWRGAPLLCQAHPESWDKQMNPTYWEAVRWQDNPSGDLEKEKIMERFRFPEGIPEEYREAYAGKVSISYEKENP